MTRSIIPGGNNQKHCFLGCASLQLERHHCLHGSRRKKAEKWGLTVYLCPKCHRLLHDTGLNDLFLEQVAQQAFEAKYDHELWMKEFGKDYL